MPWINFDNSDRNLYYITNLSRIASASFVLRFENSPNKKMLKLLKGLASLILTKLRFENKNLTKSKKQAL